MYISHPPTSFAPQAGLVGLLVTQYRAAILVSLAYLGLSISYHVCSLNTRW